MGGELGRVWPLSAKEVAAAAEALRSTPLEQRRSRFDPARFDELRIHPNPRPGGWTEEQIASLWDAYPRLVHFFEAAAAAGNVVLVYLA